MKMKRSLMLAMIPLPVVSAYAQSSVSITGLLDAGISSIRVSGVSRKVGLDSGAQNQSRFIFRGKEDLGGGWQAVFMLDHAPAVDTGDYLLGRYWGRQSYVGLTSRTYGSIQLGRNMTVGLRLSAIATPFGVSHGTANIATVFGYNDSDLGVGRANNSIYYLSPKIGGAEFVLGYSFEANKDAESTGSGNNDRLLDIGVRYQNGPLNAMAYYQRLSPTDSSPNRGTMTNYAVGANYNFGFLTLYGGYGNTKNIRTVATWNRLQGYVTGATAANFTKDRAWVVGASMPTKYGSVYAAAQRATESKVGGWAVGYSHYLSKRTNLYTYFADHKVHNWTSSRDVHVRQLAAGLAVRF